MDIREYEPSYRDEMLRVCLDTASERARTNGRHRRFTELMYCEPYLDNGTCLMLLDDAQRLHGYILCAESFDAYRSFMRPYIAKIKELGPPYSDTVEERVNAGYGRFANRFPAHMHIDIEEPYTGGGNGRRLMQALVERLRSHGVRGLMLGVAKSNRRACGFYRSCGFEVLEESPDGYTMGLVLD